jgi:hypothetical protein
LALEGEDNAAQKGGLLLTAGCTAGQAERAVAENEKKAKQQKFVQKIK